MSRVPPRPATTNHPLTAYALLFVVLFGFGWLGGFTWQHRALISQLWYTANEQRYLIMAGEAGPVTYLVRHDDYAALARLADEREDILGVEVVEVPGIAAMAFRSKDSPSIALVGELPQVRDMQRKFIPMICH